MFEPLKDNVVLKFPKKTNNKDSIIILKTSKKEKTSIGIIVKVGPEVSDAKIKEIKEDSKVQAIYKKTSGSKVQITNAEEFLILPADDIIALFKDKE